MVIVLLVLLTGADFSHMYTSLKRGQSARGGLSRLSFELLWLKFQSLLGLFQQRLKQHGRLKRQMTSKCLQLVTFFGQCGVSIWTCEELLWMKIFLWYIDPLNRLWYCADFWQFFSVSCAVSWQDFITVRKFLLEFLLNLHSTFYIEMRT